MLKSYDDLLEIMFEPSQSCPQSPLPVGEMRREHTVLEVLLTTASVTLPPP
jgi:hypothetical protein